jgi:hypothetical protein
MAGKKARCKKCRESFRIPGGPPRDDDDGDSHHLSVADPLPALPTPPANPFAFDEAPPAGGAVDQPTPVPPAVAKKPKRAPVSASAPTPDPDAGGFDFATATPAPARAESPTPRSARRPSTARGTGRFVVIGVIGLVCAAGGAAGVYFAMQPQTKPGPAAAPVAEKPAAPTGAGEEQADKAKSGSRRDRGTAKAADAKGEQAGALRAKRGVTVTGGFKLPAFPAGKGEIVEKAKYKFPVEADPAKVRRVLVSGTEAAVVAVVWRSFEGFKGAGATDTVDRYSLNSGKLVDRQEIAADGVLWPRACDLSPGGDRLATEFPVGKLTVWDLNGKSKLVDGLDPYKGAPAGQVPGVAAVYFLDDEKLAVVSKLGDVDVWDIKAKSRVVEGTRIDGITPAAPLADRRSVAITPDRKTVLAVAGATVFEVPTATCKPRPGLALPKPADAGYALAADASGSRVIVAYRATEPAPHTRLMVGRLGEEKPQMDLTIDEAVGQPVAAGWTGGDVAVVATEGKDAVSLLVDAETNRVVAGLKPTATPAVQQPGSATGLHWYVLPDAANAKQAVLAGVAMPFDSYFTVRDANETKAVGLTLGAEGVGK